MYTVRLLVGPSHGPQQDGLRNLLEAFHLRLRKDRGCTALRAHRILTPAWQVTCTLRGAVAAWWDSTYSGTKFTKCSGTGRWESVSAGSATCNVLYKRNTGP